MIKTHTKDSTVIDKEIIKFETINGQLCLMLEKPDTINEFSKTPCVIACKYGGLKKYYILDFPPSNPSMSMLAEGFEILGYPVEDGSAEWALYRMMQRDMVCQKDSHFKRYYKNGNVRWLDRAGIERSLTTELFLKNFADTSGWQLYEPEPEPEPEIVAHKQHANCLVCGKEIEGLLDGHATVSIKRYSISSLYESTYSHYCGKCFLELGFDATERELRNRQQPIAEPKQEPPREPEYVICKRCGGSQSVPNPAVSNTAYTTCPKCGGTGYEIREQKPDNLYLNIKPSNPADWCFDKKNLLVLVDDNFKGIVGENVTREQVGEIAKLLAEPTPLAVQVGDYVRTSKGDGKVIEVPLTMPEVILSNGQRGSFHADEISVISPTEVRVKITLEGTVGICISNVGTDCFSLKTKNTWYAIPYADLDTTTAAMVRELIEKQGEEK